MVKTALNNELSLEEVYNKFKGTGFKKKPIKILLPNRDYESKEVLWSNELQSTVYGESRTAIDNNTGKVTKAEQLITNLR